MGWAKVALPLSDSIDTRASTLPNDLLAKKLSASTVLCDAESAGGKVSGAFTSKPAGVYSHVLRALKMARIELALL